MRVEAVHTTPSRIYIVYVVLWGKSYPIWQAISQRSKVYSLSLHSAVIGKYVKGVVREFVKIIAILIPGPKSADSVAAETGRPKTDQY